MKLNLVYSLTFLLIMISPAFSQSQELSKKEKKAMLIKAENNYDDNRYKSAANLFEQLYNSEPSDLYYKLMLGICYSYIHSKSEESLQLVQEVQQENPEYHLVYLHLGRSYAVNHQFNKAIDNFKRFMNSEEISDAQYKKAQLYINNCENAKRMVADSLEVEITNLGPPVNTKYEEYVPIISPDESVLIFTYRGIESIGGRVNADGEPDTNGNYNEDVMISYKLENGWTDPEGIGENINSSEQDASVALSVSGEKLFIYKSSTESDGNGNIYLSELENGTWSTPEKLKGEVNSEYWEGSVSMNADESMLYFASERPKGYGGRDLWSAERLSDGSWGNIKNLGNTINTKYDEDAPFIHPDGKTMYFSSRGHNSMGGYDIFYTYLNEGEWDEPGNVGYPVNTFYDERYYILSANGKKGYYSSAGVNSTMGGHDILTVEPGHFGKKPVVALTAKVGNLKSQPTLADIIDSIPAADASGDKGLYTLSITPGDRHKIGIEVEGDGEKISYINVGTYEAFIESEENPMTFAEEKKQEAIDSSIITAQKVEGKKAQGSKNRLYKSEDRLPTENMKIKGLGFKLEIADLKDTSEVQLNQLAKYGKINKKTYPSGKVHYFFENFRTLEEVENFKRKLYLQNPEMAKKLVTVFVLKRRNASDSIEQYEEATPEALAQADCQKGGLDLFASFLLTKVPDQKNYQRMLDSLGGYCSEGLTFEVQIAAYRKPKNYEYDFLEGLGKVKIRDYPDDITRFTQGSFVTFKDAEAFRQQIIAKGQEDAWITPFYNHRRLLMKELINGEFTQNHLMKEPSNRIPIRTQELWF